MSTVVIGIGASHATLMNTFFDQTKDQAGAKRFRAGLEEARGLVEQARPDAAVVVGANHFQGFFLDLMPAFTVGVGEAVGEGEGGTPGGPLPVDPALGRAIAWGLQEREFDIALSLRLHVDHGITQCLQYLTPELGVPIVPLVINTFTPPLPSLRRCFALGRALREIVQADAQDKRVAVFASGGLSHTLPFWPKWFEDLSDDQREMVDALYEGADRDNYNERRGTIMQAAKPQINQEFDENFLRMLAERDYDELLSYSSEELEELAGNGGQEIRSWLVATAAVDGAARKLAYSPMHEWHTGMGVSAMLVEPEGAAA
jgi:2,3-dihydroxyphenylpropionate 1,2-dioxygenase